MPGLPALLALVIVAACIVTVRSASETLFGRSRALRRRLLGSQDVEGTWFDIIRRGDAVVEIGVSRLGYEGGRVHFAGEDYPVGTPLAFTYYSEMVRLDWPELKYTYKARRTDRDDVATYGYGELTFATGVGPPTRYSGAYVALQSNDKLTFQGYRLDERADADLLADLGRADKRPSALARLLQRFGGIAQPQPHAPTVGANGHTVSDTTASATRPLSRPLSQPAVTSSN